MRAWMYLSIWVADDDAVSWCVACTLEKREQGPKACTLGITQGSSAEPCWSVEKK